MVYMSYLLSLEYTYMQNKFFMLFYTFSFSKVGRYDITDFSYCSFFFFFSFIFYLLLYVLWLWYLMPKIEKINFDSLKKN